jgi:hypothetical protein
MSNRMSHHGDPLFLQVEKAAGSRSIKKILQIAISGNGACSDADRVVLDRRGPSKCRESIQLRRRDLRIRAESFSPSREVLKTPIFLHPDVASRGPEFLADNSARGRPQ